MKKRYKLIKMYSSLPKDWEIGMIVGLGDRTWGYSPESLKYDYFEPLSNLEVETNPEFWQELKCLFTTTDGVYIYEVEQSVLVDKETLEIKKLDYNIGNNFSMCFIIFTTKAAEKFVKEQKKENAEKYIEENKPKYSYLDLVRYFNLISGYNPEILDLFNIWIKNNENGLGN